MAVIQKTTYKDQVIDYIYNLVLDGHFLPGEQIKESLLAIDIGISRAPVREALKELVTNGIVEYRPQVGNFIALLSPDQIVDAYTTRGVLEGYAIMATRDQFDEADIDQLKSLVVKMKKSAIKGNRKKVVEVGGVFHDLLVSKNRNAQLAEYTKRLSLKLHVLFHKYLSNLYLPEEIGSRHLKIVTSLVAGDPVEIERTTRNHYIETGTKIATLYRQSTEQGEERQVV